MKLEKVLLIDDSDIDNMVNKKVIEKTGVAKSIVIKKSAQSALDYLKDLSSNAFAEIPDVIFLDIRMPEIDGFGFLEKYEDLPEVVTRKIAIIMLSSSIDQDDYNRALANKYVRFFLNKPLKKENIEAVAKL